MNIARLLSPWRRGMCLLMRQNFAPEVEQGVNKQILLELKAAYEYLSMAYYFDRSDLALSGAHSFFKANSAEESAHAQQFMQYMNRRGGTIQLQAIPAPQAKYKTIKEAMHEALKLELDTNQALLDLHALAGEHSDASLADFLETNFLQEQIKQQKLLADYIRQLEWCENEVGVFAFDFALRK